MITANAFAAIEAPNLLAKPNVQYVGKVVAAIYNGGTAKNIMLITVRDPAMDKTDLAGLAIIVSGDDMPYGYTLAGAIGKDVSAEYHAENNTVNVNMVTPGYSTGMTTD